MSWIELVAQRLPGMQIQARGKPPHGTKNTWYRIENATADTADIYVYDAVGGWGGLCAEDFVNDLKSVKARNINLRINSPGGGVFEGITIANALRAHPACVTTYVDGLAASIASVIALAGDRVVMMPQSQLMIHDASGMCAGNEADMRQMAELLDKQSDNIAAAYAARAGGSAADWRTTMKAETWFLADEAVAAGLADEAMPLPTKEDGDGEGEEEEEPDEDGEEEEQAEELESRHPLAALMNRAWDLSVFRYAGRDQAPAPAVARIDNVVTPNAEQIVDRVIATLREQGLLPAVEDAAGDHVQCTACPSHSTAVKEGTWDAGAEEKKLPSPMPLATARRMYAWYDASKVVDGKIPKNACKLPHHFVTGSSPGAASLAGVRNALARLPQTQGISSAEKSAIQAHLRKHLGAQKGGSPKSHQDPQIVNVMRQFDEGDVVAVIGVPHEPEHTKGVIEIVNGNAYGIRFENPDDDTMMTGDCYKWYVDDELQFVHEGADRGYAEAGEEAESESETEGDTIVPGVSHPYGVPRSQSSGWSDVTSGLFSPVPQPSSADVILSNLFKEAL
jgi:ATP-dependent protease ClpP protease subunit